MRRPSLPVLLAVLTVAAAAQPERLLMRTFTTTDGLPSNQVSDIVQDSAGVVWVATDRGVVARFHDRFMVDRSFQDELVPFGPVRMARSRQSNGFFVVGPGTAREAAYVRTLWQWEGYRLRILFPEWEGDSTDGTGFSAVAETPDGEVVLGTSGRGLWTRRVPARRVSDDDWLFRGAPALHIPLQEHVTSLAVASDGSVRVGTMRGLFHLRAGRIERSAWPELRTASVTDLVEDAEHRTWVATTAGAFSIADDRVERVPHTARTSVTSVASTPNGDIWVGTAAEGLWRIRHGALKIFHVADGLPSNRIRVLRVDRAGTLWAGTDRGLVKILPYSYRRYDAGRELPAGEWHSSIVAPDGVVWAGGTGALARFAGSDLRVWSAPASMRRMAFKQIASDGSGTIWAMVDKGVVGFDGRSFRLIHDDSVGRDRWHASFMVSGGRSGVAVVHPWSVRRIRNGGLETVLRNDSGRPLNDAAFDRDGVLWVMSWTACWAIHPDGSVRSIPQINGGLRMWTLGSGEVVIVDRSRGVVLSSELTTTESDASARDPKVGSESGSYTDGFVTRDGRRFVIWGASFVREQTATWPEETAVAGYTERYLKVLLLRGDDRPLLGLLSGDGSSYVLLDKDRKTMLPQSLLASLVLHEFNAEDMAYMGTGVGSHINRFQEDPGGTLWCIGRRGIMALPPADPAPDPEPPFINVLTAGDQRLLPGLVTSLGVVSTVQRWWKGRAVGVPSGFADGLRITLGADDNDLRFETATSSHQQEMGVLYQARLGGLDTAWSAPQLDGTFAFRDVPQGSYEFRVRTVRATGAVSPERTMQISLILPFWRTTWFGVMMAVTAAYVTFQIASRRLRRLREDHARLTRQAVQENEMRMARAVQMGMLPERAPDVAGFEFAARSMPATEVGGDFYDFLSDGGRLGIAVGDVSGHGITGAMIVGMARTSLRFASSRFDRPSRIMTLANDRLRQDISRNVFIAMFYGLLDPKKRTLRYICAGQPTPILIRNGAAAFLPHSKGDRFPLGIVPSVSYREEQVTLRPGDTLVLYTDGFVEAMNGAREEYGFERFARTLERLVDLPATAFIDAVCADVGIHAAGAPQEDDMTMVVIRVRKGGRS